MLFKISRNSTAPFSLSVAENIESIWRLLIEFVEHREDTGWDGLINQLTDPGTRVLCQRTATSSGAAVIQGHPH